MLNFEYNVPTRIFFGKGQIERLREIKAVGTKALLVYGGGSIKRTGIYDAVLAVLQEIGMPYLELANVEPNPRIDSVREGVRICRENNLDVVLAVGGGSVIDCSKIIAAGTLYDGDPWELVKDARKIQTALPVVTVLTNSATGSEMNGGAVIANPAGKQKLGTGSIAILPRFSILDPEYTMTVPGHLTAAGVVDIMSHTFENYFTPVTGGYVQARICEALLLTCIKYGPIACNFPENYEARANLMWTSSLAINGLCKWGQQVGWWSVHPLEQELAAFYDTTHGVGLAILTPAWMRYILNDSTVHKFAEYGVNVWDIDKTKDPYDIAGLAIDKTEDFFKSLNMPAKLSELGIDDEHFAEMGKRVESRTLQGFVPLTAEDAVRIYYSAL
ncbi:MAG TPA: iron-containing alcohol dehydrogenase [Oscillospiraceae bacterium]|nr:iron-containing alcohol dehydrogenase [Oscillospiraceae bacterium]